MGQQIVPGCVSSNPPLSTDLPSIFWPIVNGQNVTSMGPEIVE